MNRTPEQIADEVRALIRVASGMTHADARARLDAILAGVPTATVNGAAKLLCCWRHNRKGIARVLAELVENHVAHAG